MSRIYKLVVFSVFFTLILLSYRGEVSKQEDNKALEEEVRKKIAVVNGDPVYLWDLERELERWKRNYSRSGGGAVRDPMRLMKSVLEKLIEEKLIRQEAKKLHVVVTDFEIEGALKANTAGYDSKVLKSYLQKQRLSMNDLRKRITYNLLVQKLSSSVIEKGVSVSAKEVSAYYKKNKKEFNTPLRVRALQILVADKEESQRIRKKLIDGADFSEMARNISISPEAEMGGDLGYFEEGMMPEEFDRVLFKMKVNTISHPVQTNYGFHIFKLVDKIGPKKPNKNEALSLIRKRILDGKRDKAFQKWKRGLIGRSDIKISEEFL